MPVYRCSFCPVSRRQLSEIQSHHSDSHNRFTNLCHYCNLAFNDKNLFKEHIRKQHVLSVHDKSRVGNPIVHQQGHQQPEQQHQQQQRRTLTWSAFRKNLRSYRIVDSNNTVGLLDFMTAERNEINDIIEQKTLNEGPQKVQFSAKLSLHKEARDNGEASDIDIYANSEMTPVYHQLSDETIFHMVEKMLTVLFVFASNGSRWFLQKIIWVDLTFAKFSPLRGSSFIELPLCLRNQRFFFWIYATMLISNVSTTATPLGTMKCMNQTQLTLPKTLEHNWLTRLHTGNLRLQTPREVFYANGLSRYTSVQNDEWAAVQRVSIFKRRPPSYVRF